MLNIYSLMMNCRLWIYYDLLSRSIALSLDRLDRKARDADGNRALNQFY
jgi:hypothetical protein